MDINVILTSILISTIITGAINLLLNLFQRNHDHTKFVYETRYRSYQELETFLSSFLQKREYENHTLYFSIFSSHEDLLNTHKKLNLKFKDHFWYSTKLNNHLIQLNHFLDEAVNSASQKDPSEEEIWMPKIADEYYSKCFKQINLIRIQICKDILEIRKVNKFLKSKI